MAEINQKFKVKKGLDVLGTSTFTGDTTVTGNADVSGYITVPTQAQVENSTKVATTAFVRTAIADLIASSPATLDTLNELAAALGDDPNFATTMTNNLALKAPLASPALTGTPTAPTASAGTSTTQLATTAFVTAADNLKANIASPTFTGTPAAPTPAFNNDSTQIPTTGWVLDNSLPFRGELAGGVDLNTLTENGVYTQQTNADATSGVNYPVLYAGLLEVVGTVSMIWQRYTVYITTQPDVYVRTWYSGSGGVWGAWRKIAYTDSPVFTGVPSAPTAALGTNTSQLANTAFVQAAMAAAGIGTDASSIPGGGTASIDQTTIPTGFYQVTSSNTGTKPSGETAGFLFVAQATSSRHQLYLDNTTAQFWSRTHNGTSWTAWREVAFTDSPAFTGTPTAPTASPNTNTTQVATTAYADAIAALKANIASPSFTGTSTFGGTAVFNGEIDANSDVVVVGTVSDSLYTTLPMVEGGSYTTTSATVTGAIKIKLPTAAYPTTMISFDVDVYENVTNASFKMRISGYARNSDSSWGGATAVMLGGTASKIPSVRYGNDGTSICIWLGETTDVWTIPQINITNVRLGYSGMTNQWLAAWNISFATTLDTVKTGPITPLKAAGLASPALTGTPTAPTASTGTNTTQLATTAFVQAQAASQIAAGNSATSTKLQTARTIGLAGDATGSALFDGSADATITVAVVDDSHNHTISTLTGVQALLDAKFDETGGVIGNQTTGWAAVGSPTARIVDTNSATLGGLAIESYQPKLLFLDRTSSAKSMRMRVDAGNLYIGNDDGTLNDVWNEQVRIIGDGYMVIGGTSSADVKYYARGTNVGTATTQYCFFGSTEFNESATNAGVVYQATPTVKDAVYTMGTLIGLRVSNPVIGAQATITSYDGVQVINPAAIVGSPTRVSGYYSNVASGTNRWNLYMTGSALNYFNGKLLVGSTTDGSTGKVQVTETTNEFVYGAKNTASKQWVWGLNATGMYFRNSTDTTTPLNFMNNGNVLIGTAADDGSGSVLQVSGNVKSTGVLYTAALLVTGVNTGVELGSTSQANTPYVDFHSSGNNIDYDARILASGGTASDGNGVLTYTAATHNFVGVVTVPTAAVGDNSTKAASTAFAMAASEAAAIVYSIVFG